MYLGAALKRALPYAILDREDFVRTRTEDGAELEEARKACDDLKALAGVKVHKFTETQRETARLALCWAEQYLEGYIDALGSSDKQELEVSSKELRQIRAVRLEHFGLTANEAEIKTCTLVEFDGGRRFGDLMEMLRPVMVVCGSCSTKTNGRSAGDSCSWCKVGVFQPM